MGPGGLCERRRSGDACLIENNPILTFKAAAPCLGATRTATPLFRCADRDGRTLDFLFHAPRPGRRRPRGSLSFYDVGPKTSRRSFVELAAQMSRRPTKPGPERAFTLADRDAGSASRDTIFILFYCQLRARLDVCLLFCTRRIGD